MAPVVAWKQIHHITSNILRWDKGRCVGEMSSYHYGCATCPVRIGTTSHSTELEWSGEVGKGEGFPLPSILPIGQRPFSFFHSNNYFKYLFLIIFTFNGALHRAPDNPSQRVKKFQLKAKFERGQQQVCPEIPMHQMIL